MYRQPWILVVLSTRFNMPSLHVPCANNNPWKPGILWFMAAQSHGIWLAPENTQEKNISFIEAYQLLGLIDHFRLFDHWYWEWSPVWWTFVDSSFFEPCPYPDLPTCSPELHQGSTMVVTWNTAALRSATPIRPILTKPGFKHRIPMYKNQQWAPSQ